MTILAQGAIAAHEVTTALAGCNLKLIAYSSLAGLSLLGILLARSEKRVDEAREKVAHVVIYLLLGLL